MPHTAQICPHYCLMMQSCADIIDTHTHTQDSVDIQRLLVTASSHLAHRMIPSVDNVNDWVSSLVNHRLVLNVFVASFLKSNGSIYIHLAFTGNSMVLPVSDPANYLEGKSPD